MRTRVTTSRGCVSVQTHRTTHCGQYANQPGNIGPGGQVMSELKVGHRQDLQSLSLRSRLVEAKVGHRQFDTSGSHEAYAGTGCVSVQANLTTRAWSG